MRPTSPSGERRFGSAKIFGGGFFTRDHFGGKAKTLREAVTTFVNAHSQLVNDDDKILMLAAPRSFGYVFNPLTVFYCVTPQKEIKYAILEVHNTYGERHAYLLHPQDAQDLSVEKAFYVSPFFEVRGTYDVKIRLDEEKIVSVVNLKQDDKLVFSASFAGTPHRANFSTRALTVFRYPFSNYQTMMRIKFHGILLYLRKLPVIKRTPHPQQEGML